MKYLKKYNEGFTDKLQSKDKDQLIHILTNILNKVHGNKLFDKADENLKEFLHIKGDPNPICRGRTETYDFFEKNREGKWCLNMVHDPNTFSGACDYVAIPLHKIREWRLKGIIDEIMRVEGMLEILYRDISIDVNEEYNPPLTRSKNKEELIYMLENILNKAYLTTKRELIDGILSNDLYNTFDDPEDIRAWIGSVMRRDDDVITKYDFFETDPNGEWTINIIYSFPHSPIHEKYDSVLLTDLDKFMLGRIINILIKNKEILEVIYRDVGKSVNEAFGSYKKINLPDLTHEGAMKMIEHIIEIVKSQSVDRFQEILVAQLMREPFTFKDGREPFRRSFFFRNLWKHSAYKGGWKLDGIEMIGGSADPEIDGHEYGDVIETFELSEFPVEDLKNIIKIWLDNPDFIRFLASSDINLNLFKDINEKNGPPNHQANMRKKNLDFNKKFQDYEIQSHIMEDVMELLNRLNLGYSSSLKQNFGEVWIEETQSSLYWYGENIQDVMGNRSHDPSHIKSDSDFTNGGETSNKKMFTLADVLSEIKRIKPEIIANYNKDLFQDINENDSYLSDIDFLKDFNDYEDGDDEEFIALQYIMKLLDLMKIEYLHKSYSGIKEGSLEFRSKDDILQSINYKQSKESKKVEIWWIEYSGDWPENFEEKNHQLTNLKEIVEYIMTVSPQTIGDFNMKTFKDINESNTEIKLDFDKDFKYYDKRDAVYHLMELMTRLDVECDVPMISHNSINLGYRYQMNMEGSDHMDIYLIGYEIGGEEVVIQWNHVCEEDVNHDHPNKYFSINIGHRPRITFHNLKDFMKFFREEFPQIIGNFNKELFTDINEAFEIRELDQELKSISDQEQQLRLRKEQIDREYSDKLSFMLQNILDSIYREHNIKDIYRYYLEKDMYLLDGMELDGGMFNGFNHIEVNDEENMWEMKLLGDRGDFEYPIENLPADILYTTVKELLSIPMVVGSINAELYKDINESLNDINENNEESKDYNRFLMTQDGTIPSDIFLNEYKNYWEKAPLKEIEENLFSGIFLVQAQAIWNILRRLEFSFEIEQRTLTEFKRWNFNLKTEGRVVDVFRIKITGLDFHISREAPEDEPNKIEVFLPREYHQRINTIINVESLNDILKPLADKKITFGVKAEVLKDINEKYEYQPDTKIKLDFDKKFKDYQYDINPRQPLYHTMELFTRLGIKFKIIGMLDNYFDVIEMHENDYMEIFLSDFTTRDGGTLNFNWHNNPSLDDSPTPNKFFMVYVDNRDFTEIHSLKEIMEFFNKEYPQIIGNFNKDLFTDINENRHIKTFESFKLDLKV